MPKKDQGVSYTRYATIPRTLIFLFNEDMVLLLKGSPHKRIWADKFNGIGGHIERGEDVLSAGRRELEEEAGLKGIDLFLSGVVMIETGEERGITIFVLKGTYIGNNLIASEEGLPMWIPCRELTDYPVVEDLPVLIPRVRAMGKGDQPFSASYHYDENEKLIIRFAE